MIQIKDFGFYFELYETPLHAFEQRISLAAVVKNRLRITEVGSWGSVRGHC